MTSQIIRKMRQLAPERVIDIAKRASGDGSITQPGTWAVSPFGATSYGNGTLGFFKFEGEAFSDVKPVTWSSIVKVMEPRGNAEASRFNHPLREIETYRSGFLESLAKGMKAAPCFEVEDRSEGTVWLWLEDLSDLSTGAWTRDDYVMAGRRIGQFNGSLPESVVPAASWIGKLGEADRRRGAINPQSWAYPIDEAVHDPLVTRAISDMGREFVRQGRELNERLIAVTDELTLSLAHNDCHTRNLFVDRRSPEYEQLYAIDWASLGLSPVGIDAGSLFASGFTWGRDEARLAPSIDSDVFGAYCAGLVDVGVRIPEHQTRLAYLSMVSTYFVQSVMCVHQVSVNPDGALAKMVVPRYESTGPESFADEVGQRLALMKPLVNEAIDLLGLPIR